MGILEFDSEGRLILPESVKKDVEDAENSIIFTKIQVSKSSPAIAQLKITIGKNLENRDYLINQLKMGCKNFMFSNYRDVNTNLNQIGDAIIVEAKSSLKMYSFLNDLVGELRQNMWGKKIAVRGSWER